LQRIKALAADEHVYAGIAVRRKLIGALVMWIIFACVRDWDGPAVRAARSGFCRHWGKMSPERAPAGFGSRFDNGSLAGRV